MSTIPLLLRLADDLDSVPSLYDDHFGYPGLFPSRAHLHHHHAPPLALTVPPRHWLHRQKAHSERAPIPHVGKDGFQVNIDVQQFKPNELTVKTVDNYVVVEGKHEEREDEHGFISRQFIRRYALPKDYDPGQVISSLSSDGVLTIKAPPPPKEGESNERIVHIQQTGPAHLSVKENAATESNGDKE